MRGCFPAGDDAPTEPHAGASVADVVVVGAGPVGLLLASELALHRVAVTVVERLGAIVDQPKAGTLHARAAQLLRRRGYLPSGPLGGGPGALARDAFHFAAQARFPITSPLAEGAPIVGQWQGDLERFLQAVCEARGVRILRERAVIGIEQDARGARVRVDRAGCPGTQADTIHASWVVGADGARSIVRRTAGIGATDHPATLRCLVARVHLTEPSRAPAGWHEWPGGWTLVNLEPAGLSRLITFEFGVTHADRAAPVPADELRATFTRVTGRDLPFDALEYSGRFSDFSRVADTYRSGRLLLAGDAAHVHFPVGGQGLNLGIQDAFNVGWKLAMVVKGGADHALLDTYTAERRPHAERVITYTRDQAVAMDVRAESAAARALVLQQVETEAQQRALGARISAQDVTTSRGPGDHPAVGTFVTDRAMGAPGSATRLSALLAGGRGVLVTPPAGDRDPGSHAALTNLGEAWHGRIEMHVDPSGVPGQAAQLVRPDGYVAWAGREPDRAEAALRRWFGPPRKVTTRSGRAPRGSSEAARPCPRPAIHALRNDP